MIGSMIGIDMIGSRGDLDCVQIMSRYAILSLIKVMKANSVREILPELGKNIRKSSKK